MRNYDWYCFSKLFDDSGTRINPCCLWYYVACNEQPLTMHGARQASCVRCIHEGSRCKRWQQVFRGTSAQSAIWREWNGTLWEESKTAQRGQCYNPQGVDYATGFEKYNWESSYFKTFLMSWNIHSYDRECLLYFLRWHLIIETSSLTIKKPKYRLQSYLLWRCKHGAIRYWSCLSEYINYETSPASGWRIHNTAITSHSSQHRMNGPSSSTSWPF